MPASRKPGTGGLVPWAALVDNGVVQCKNGSLVAGFFFAGPDAASAPPEILNDLSFRTNQTLRRLGSGWAQWTDCVRLPAPGYPPPQASHFPDRWSRAVDDERRAQFSGLSFFNSHKALILHYTPPLQRRRRLTDLVYTEEGAAHRSAADRILDRFKQDLAEFENGFGGALILRRMGSYPIYAPDGREHFADQLVNYLNFCLTGDVIEIQIPDDGAFLDKVVGYRRFDHGMMPRIGRKYIAAIRIQGFPEQTYPQIIAALDDLDIAYRWSTRVIYLDRAEAVGEMNAMRAKWEAQQRGFWAQLFKTVSQQVSLDAVERIGDLDEAIKEGESGEVLFGHHTPLVVLMDEDPDRIEQNALRVENAIRRQHFDAVYDDVNTTEAWRGTLPGNTKANVWRPLIHTRSLADLLPLSSVWTGSGESHPNPLYPAGSPPLFYAIRNETTPFRDSLSRADNGHVFCAGPSGAGKTTLWRFLVASALRYKDATVAVLDVDSSLKGAALAFGGAHYDVGSGAAACPLDDLDTEAERIEAADWITTAFRLQTGEAPTAKHRLAIDRALWLMREDGAADRSLSMFCGLVADSDVRDAIAFYAGPMGRLFDGTRDGLAYSHLTVHEIGTLMRLGEAISVPYILHFFRKFTRLLRGQPAFLLFSEAWLAFGNPFLREKLREALKRMRKLVCAVYLETQSLADLAQNGILPIVLEACATKIWLPNPEAFSKGDPPDYPGPYDFYKAAGVSDTLIEIIATAVAKRQYLLTCSEGSALIDLILGPKALALCGAGDPPELARMTTLKTQFGEEWPDAWIDERNGKPWALRPAAE